ncbi:hypothetical protein IW261DRAFT_1333236, partial [Armillaria novae-zelandiae]
HEHKYSEDAPCAETAPNARVWRTYEDESRIHDTNMVEESRDNVDVLSLASYAGLFSAMAKLCSCTTLPCQLLLYELVVIQRAIANGSPVNSIAFSPINPTVTFVPATTDVCVNGLWFPSLFLSLTTALVAVLVKQWPHHYVALPSETPRDRSFIRQFRFAGFRKWHVQIIIGLLPVLMHLTLATFLVGLVTFLRLLRQALSWGICAGTVLVYTAYVVATVLPILFSQCPYRTPLLWLMMKTSVACSNLDGVMDDAALQLHIEYLHDSDDLYTACSILATRGFNNTVGTAIHRDIMTLVQLCPRDAAWGECHNKLRDLVALSCPRLP